MDQCEPCKFRNEDTRAIKFCVTCQELQCKTCAEIHKSSKATRNHLLVQSSELNVDSKINKDLITFQRCHDHPENQAEFYCIEHKHKLCSKCLLNIQSLNCKDIVDVESAGEQIMKCKLNEQIRTDFENTIDNCKAEFQKLKKIKDRCKSNRQEIQQYIDNLKQKLMTAFNKYEKEILEKIDTNEEKQATALNKAQDVLTKALKTAEENKNILQIVTDNGSEADVFKCALSIIDQYRDVRTQDNAFTAKLFTHSVQLSPEFATLLDSIERSPVFQCDTSRITETFAQFDNCRSNIGDILETVKQVSLERKTDLPNDYSCSSADADTEVFSDRPSESSIKDNVLFSDQNIHS